MNASIHSGINLLSLSLSFSLSLSLSLALSASLAEEEKKEASEGTISKERERKRSWFFKWWCWAWWCNDVMKPPVGIEPTTVRLRSACSANWAIEANKCSLKQWGNGEANSQCKVAREQANEYAGIPWKLQPPWMFSFTNSLTAQNGKAVKTKRDIYLRNAIENRRLHHAHNICIYIYIYIFRASIYIYTSYIHLHTTYAGVYRHVYIYKCVTYIYICIHIYVCVCISPQILNSILVYIKQTFQHKTSTTGAA